ncbi:VCBS repeat-containing protein [Epibacterium sp. MM17-32]|nr:VCBS repeat-containing protein [Epibacterium sp. MM17-32]MCG7627517.1 VCBS repeat-containing protein [Epibacterium sp. MM17-32]
MRAAGRARRLMTRIRPPVIRRAAQALCLGVAGTATLLNAQEAWRATGAEFDAPTTRYGHAVLGDDVDYSQLRIHVQQDGDAEQSTAGVRRDVFEIDLPVDHVFEDLAPRLWDITGDGMPEVVVVETDVAQGAQLAVYNSTGDKIAATPHIGQTNRWLAPVGAADLDGDGHIEVAYIDRPHLAKTLRIWRFHYGKLVEVAAAPGLTNHLIGEDVITSGLRDCGQGVEIVTVDADWSRIIASRLSSDGSISRRDLGPFDARSRLGPALDCQLP